MPEIGATHNDEIRAGVGSLRKEHVGDIDIDIDSVTCQYMQPCGSGQNGYASPMRLAAI